MFPKPSLDLWLGKAVIQGLMVSRPYLHLWDWDVQNGPLALRPGLWKISCPKQKWKNRPGELGKECVALDNRIFFSTVCGYGGIERDEMRFRN